MAKVKSLANNQTVVTFEDNGVSVSQFFSYDTLIVEVVNGITYFSSFWDYSKTTSKYRNQFTGMDTKQTKEWVKSGAIDVIDADRSTERLTVVDKKGNIHTIAS